jgi:hypothetical protein
MPDLKWLDRYSGQTTDQLLALEGEYRIDSLVLAFEQALDQKSARKGESSLSEEERVILAIEALEREVNNGGYRQFFENSSREYAPIIVLALERIGCAKTTAITQEAIDALNLPAPTADAIEAALEGDEPDEELNTCDEAYFKAGEDIAGKLFTFIKTNKKTISV